ncbi:DUF6514 family protein [Ructibacterium gallinarum]|uniref:Uncharacterized protein n=1 Tax=Ructibacterium gallinarum TaxID=2779355 RepID=A0A9D5M4D5_9FIRM|nr:DUF6514 family protein [Ructibacterium gallinarum]MBE5040484.1 hypothetical protein [Ructibacterium gallinarum]
MICYKINMFSLDDPDLGNYTSYGLDAYDENDTLVRRIVDVSPNEQTVSGLVALCNKFQVSLIHIDDIIEDFLS